MLSKYCSLSEKIKDPILLQVALIVIEDVEMLYYSHNPSLIMVYLLLL